MRQQRRNERFSRSAGALLLACGIGLSGCAATQSLFEDVAARVRVAPETQATLRLQPLASTSSNVFTRSYGVGESYTSRVGEPMLSVKNYQVGERVARASALRDFEQLCERLLSKEPGPCEQAPLRSVRGGMGSVFDVQGAVSAPDGDYFALSLTAAGQKDVTYLLVDHTGRLRSGGYVAWRQADSKGYSVGGIPLVEVVPQVALDSDEPLFTFENRQTVAASGPGYLNYDLVYAGTQSTGRGDSIFLSYREYARQATDHLMFEQTLQYSVSQRDIDVAGLHLQIDAADADSITFHVVEDSQRGAARE